MLPDLPPGAAEGAGAGAGSAPVPVWSRTVLYASAGCPVRFELRVGGRGVRVIHHPCNKLCAPARLRRLPGVKCNALGLLTSSFTLLLLLALSRMHP